MKTTSLTVGGFNQPAVARSLIELPGNAEKGLSQWFLWLFPRPVYGNFESLGTIDTVFTGKIGTYNILSLESTINWCNTLYRHLSKFSFLYT